MGRLIPDDFDITSLEPSEQRVVEALASKTSPEWLIIPTVPFVDRGQDGEADVVLVHRSHGIVVLETKGGSISVRNGSWFSYDHKLKRSPAAQASNAKYVLIRKIKDALSGLTEKIPFAVHAVAFPDAATIPTGSLGTDLEKGMIFTKAELERPEQALSALFRRTKPTTQAIVDAVVKALRPDIEFSENLDGTLRYTKQRLSDQTLAVIKIAETLDANKRVLVTGPAGSGKTRLATTWVRRAVNRGERVLLLCYNIPMAEWLAARFEDEPLVTAGTFHDTAEALLADTSFQIPALPDKDSRYYQEGLSTALLGNISEITKRFDTIVIDEVQDFQEEWFPAIEALLDETGARRQYYVGDRKQNIFQSTELDEREEWTKFELTENCRNTESIARVAQKVGGGTSIQGCPAGPEVTFRHATGNKEIRKRVAESVSTLINVHHIAPSDIAIITTRSDLREALLESDNQPAPFVRWSERDTGSIVCENVHKIKGLEWRAVILASLVPSDDLHLPKHLYVAITRATTWLHIVAPRETADLLGLAGE